MAGPSDDGHHLVDYENVEEDEERQSCLNIHPKGFQIRHPPPPHDLSAFLTPDSQLFHTIHMGAAVVDKDRWRLMVTGMVQRRFTVTFAQLLRMPRASVTSFHECYGSPLIAPRQAKNLWRIGNVTWTGVRLRTLLEMAQPSVTATHVWSDGLDHGSFASVEADRYQKDLPLEKARSPEVLLAYEMNGHALSKERGGPVRLVVPGWYGTNSTKWICRLSVQAERAPSPFTTTFYNAPDPDDPSGKLLPVWKVHANSFIVRPQSGEQLLGPNVDVSGFAWSCDGITSVVVSIDSAETWIEATVKARTEKLDFSWQPFTVSLNLSQGQYQVMARATSMAGLQQPLGGRRNSVHIVEFSVGEI